MLFCTFTCFIKAKYPIYAKINVYKKNVTLKIARRDGEIEICEGVSNNVLIFDILHGTEINAK